MRRSYPWLWLGPVVEATIGVISLTLAWFWPDWIIRGMFAMLGAVTLGTATYMIRTNIAHGFGWHGQKWPDDPR